MNYIVILSIVFFAFLFLPIKIRIAIEAYGNLKIEIKLFNFKIATKKIKFLEANNLLNRYMVKEDKTEELEEAIYTISKKFFKAEEQIENYLTPNQMKKIYDRLDFHEIYVAFGTQNPTINVAVYTIINMLLASQGEKFKATQIETEMFYSEELYKYKINCIFSVRIAENIVEITQVICKVIKERWKNIWQIIQLKT